MPRRVTPDAVCLCQPQPHRGNHGAGRSAPQPLRRGGCAAARRTQPQRTQPARGRRLDDQLGEPILVSAITRIEGGQLEYRGRDAIALAESASLEDVAALLWQVGSLPCARSPQAWPRAHAPAGAPERCIAAMADLAMAGRWAGRVDSVVPDAVRILERMAWSAAGLPGST